MNKPKIRQYLKDNPQRKVRSQVYPILQEMILEEYGVSLSIERLTKIVRAHRSLQEEIDVDLFGKEKEKNWREERGQKSLVEFAEEANITNRIGQVYSNGNWYKIK